jgi:hypothetical protein
MRDFPAEVLRPTGAVLNGLIFKNDFLGIPESFFYSIQIELERFSFDGEYFETEINLNFISFGSIRPKFLEFRKFDFPVNPGSGHIEGSIYLLNTHLPFDVKQIEFGSWHGDSIDVTILYDLDFEYENLGVKKVRDKRLQFHMRSGAIDIDEQIQEEANFNFIHIERLVSKYIPLKELQVIESQSGQKSFRILVD